MADAQSATFLIATYTHGCWTKDLFSQKSTLHTKPVRGVAFSIGADVVLLAHFHAVVTQDGVGGGGVKEKVRQAVIE